MNKTILEGAEVKILTANPTGFCHFFTPASKTGVVIEVASGDIEKDKQPYRVKSHETGAKQWCCATEIEVVSGKSLVPVQCPYCLQSHDVNPASLLARKPRTMTPAAIEQRKAAANKPRTRKAKEDQR